MSGNSRALSAERSNVPSKRRAVPPVEYSLEDLEIGREDIIKNHILARSTRTKYDGYVERGREFLEKICKLKQDELDVEHLRGKDAIDGSDSNIGGSPFRDPLFLQAFDGHPNEFSPDALEMLLTQKCYNEKKGKSTADGIYAAFKEKWDKCDRSGTYSGKWHYDHHKMAWVGNPALAPNVQNILRGIKHKIAEDSTVRHHSMPMTYDLMDKILSWSKTVCPAFDLEKPPATVDDLKMKFTHLQRRAFMTTGFNLWTRNDELADLRVGDITFNCEGPPPYKVKHFRICLSNRKGWQKKVDHSRADLLMNEYGIYDQPDKPAINCYREMLLYLAFLERHVLGRRLEPTDYVFPAMGSNGVVQPGEHVSPSTVQSWLDEAVTILGIHLPSGARFTLHCFRRGGAQYRFMHAPLGERWTLDRIRWWGSWAKGEQNDTTLMKYLLNELQFYEEHHSDALCPTAPEPQVSLLGEHSLLKSATIADVHALQESINNSFNDVKGCLQGFTAQLGNLSERLSDMDRRSSSFPNVVTLQCSHAAEAHISQQQPFHTINTTNTGILNPAPVTIPQTSAINPPPQPPLNTQHNNYSPPAPRPGICIPSVPIMHGGRRDRSTGLTDIVFHWENPDTDNGLTRALKDWPLEWTTGDNKPRFAVKYFQRSVIALEYIETYHRDDAAFKQAYPGWARGSTYLLNAINDARRARGVRPERPNTKSTMRARK